MLAAALLQTPMFFLLILLLDWFEVMMKERWNDDWLPVGRNLAGKAG